MESIEIRQRIRRIRKAKKLSQAQCADLLGVHVNTFNNLERGKTKLTEDNLTDIADILGTSVHYLMYGVEETYILGDKHDPYEGSSISSLKSDIVYLKKLIDNQEEKITRLQEDLERTLSDKAKVEKELARLKENR